MQHAGPTCAKADDRFCWIPKVTLSQLLDFTQPHDFHDLKQATLTGVH